MHCALWTVTVSLTSFNLSCDKVVLSKRKNPTNESTCGKQVCAEVAIVILDENTPASRSWFTWRDILHLVDIICCCAILFPIVWSIKHLREAAGVSFLDLHHRSKCLCAVLCNYLLCALTLAPPCHAGHAIATAIRMLTWAILRRSYAACWRICVDTIASRMQTDGKAARNLLKLQLFRQFYVMVVVYIYFTRIVVYLLRSTMPYQYAWLPDAAGWH